MGSCLPRKGPAKVETRRPFIWRCERGRRRNAASDASAGAPRQERVKPMRVDAPNGRETRPPLRTRQRRRVRRRGVLPRRAGATAAPDASVRVARPFRGSPIASVGNVAPVFERGRLLPTSCGGQRRPDRSRGETVEYAPVSFRAGVSQACGALRQRFDVRLCGGVSSRRRPPEKELV